MNLQVDSNTIRYVLCRQFHTPGGYEGMKKRCLWTGLNPTSHHQKYTLDPWPTRWKSRQQRHAVGTLKDGYVHNVPLPRIPQIKSASHDTSHELITPSRCIQEGTPLPDYLQVSSWIPTLPKLGSLLGFSQRVL